MPIEVVCVDMFQTLVDLDARRPQIWSRILGADYSQEAMESCGSTFFGIAIPQFNGAGSSPEFRTAREIFCEAFSQVNDRLGLDLDPAQAAQVFVEEHGNAPSYPETEQFLTRVASRYPVCLVSDADTDMVAPLLKRFRFDQTFISEELHSYKVEQPGRMFASVLKHYGCAPDRVVHIGDSYADVSGASQYGITTCWLNRVGRAWEHQVRPTFTADNLLTVADRLDRWETTIAVAQ
jgi:putative hydrolase of the HAD superfamily